MKAWIKLETGLLQDERIKQLINKLGMKGLGLYVATRLFMGKCNGKETYVNDLMDFISGYCSRRVMGIILNDYGLFCISGGLVRACVPGIAREIARGGEPISDKKENIDIYSSVGFSDGVAGAAGCFSKYRDEPWFPRIGELLSPSNMMWREPLLMHCGYGALLGSHWVQAVLFFVEHVIIQDELQRLGTEKDCRQYFANFSRISTPSGKALMEHLKALVPDVKPAVVYDGPPVPADAPRRPSPTAQWDNATDSWTEVH